ncbi:LamG-like jellyroll fold domain-containing protein [Aurantibacillus circumpalustris]|uniref:LamG-like jellyroll fold domain-containing protein n=1 Tax=Aurantibacillus circumpalustris TaxID=3036359 RepID=UPI00295C10CF|nr:LamG-like jellyroll fold domain-containing protein [Aurantibacillus circumpalustris]
MLKYRTLLFFILLAVYAKSQLSNKPVASYYFNNGKVDTHSRLTRPKMLGISFVEDRFGNKESAIYLHGNNSSYINLGTDSVLKPKKGTISLWVNVELIVQKGTEGWDYNPILITKSHAGDDFYEGYFIGLNFNTNKINVTTSKDHNNQITLNSRGVLSLRKWHHIVMTYDDDWLALYLDNKLEARLQKRFRSVFLNGDSVIIGNTANKKNERYLCGTIDDINIYDRVISQQEVDKLFNESNPDRLTIYLKWLSWILALVLLIIFIVWIIVRKFKRDLEMQNEKNKINAHMNELETRAIRTQMNPHFIFNSLNTLQRFILEEDALNANSYLVKFSKLLRKLLESSISESISLKEEMEILNSYLELEKLRFDKSFEVIIESTISDPKNVQIPFMLIQPFVENAIWHGLLPKQDNRVLKITLSDIDGKTLLCRIDDNGVGRKYSFKQKDPFKKKSMAIEFIKQRLDILEKATGINCSFKITDKENSTGESEGTLVEIVIPKFN